MTAPVLNEDEASRIAGELTAKYGPDALDFAAARAARAIAVGDELAYDAWQSVIAAARALLERSPLAV